jgi:hypothetical protein
MRATKIAAACAAAALLGVGPVAADLCTIEATPAATLLLPYFEVDIDDPNGIDTFMSINNASPGSVLTHVIVWTDMSVEALDFNIYLTGYDVQTFGLGLAIRNGVIPRTGDANSVSPRGAFSDPHPGSQSAVDLGSCPSFMPYTNPALDEDFLEHLQSILTGGPSAIYNGRCGGIDHGDNIARGYVTVDVVEDCSLLTPCDPGYFNGYFSDTDIGAYDNVIWGDWYMVDYANNFAQGDNLVHVEALQPIIIVLPPDPGVGEGMGGGPFPAGTFWQRCELNDGLLGPFPFYDLREPLASTFATRFYQNAAFDGGTDLLVWRGSYSNVFLGEEDGFSCGAGPSFFFNEHQTVAFDEQENPEALCTVSPCPEADILFPYEAQRVSVTDLQVVPDSGWLYLNLNQVRPIPAPPAGAIADYPVSGQAWVVAVHSAEGRFSAGLPAIQLDSTCDLRSIVIGPSGPDFPEVFPEPDPLFGMYLYYVGAPGPRPAP